MAYHNFYFTNGRRGGNLLVFNENIYRISKTNKTGSIKYWKCKCSCSVRLTTENDVLVNIGDQNLHNHNNQKIESLILEFLNKLRYCITADPSQLLENLYRKELEKLSADMRPLMPQYSVLRHTLNNYRRNVLPNIPSHKDEINLTGNLRYTKDGDNFVLWDGIEENRFLILGTERTLELLCKCEKIFMDGTFQTIPRPLFYQMYTLHGLINNKIFPLLFCLLPNKTENTYVRMLLKIKDIAWERQLVFQPYSFHVDYEKAVLNAINIVFPHAEIKGCYFHFCQAIYRKIQELGLTKIYKENKEVRKWFRMIFTLPLVNMNDVDNAWLLIMSDCPNSTAIENLADYLVNTWIDDLGALFDRAIWNHFDTHYHRTTNALESWHANLKRRIQRNNPNFFMFLDVLKSECMYTNVKIHLALQNKLIDTRNAKAIKKETNILNLKIDYTSKVITLEYYITKMGLYTPKKWSH